MLKLRNFMLTGAVLAVLVLVPVVSTEAARVARPIPASLVSMNGAGSKAPCGVAAPKCCYNPCIIYRYRRPCRKVCCGCDPPVKTTLTVQDPCACDCYVDIPVCLPACCQGEPCVKSRCGLLCKGVVTYRWRCGYKVVVTFKKRGDIVVTSFGR